MTDQPLRVRYEKGEWLCEVEPCTCKHTKTPRDFNIDRLDRGGDVSLTHEQTQCPCCGLWSVWKRKKP